MHHVGIGLHLPQATICVLDGRGNRVNRGVVRGGVDRVVEWLRGVPCPFDVCFEASTGYGRAFEELAKVACTVKVAHPGHLRLIVRAKKKTDRVDAEKLAKLLFLGEVPEIHVPRRDVRAWRSLINYRHRLPMRTAAVKISQLAQCLNQKRVTAALHQFTDREPVAPEIQLDIKNGLGKASFPTFQRISFVVQLRRLHSDISFPTFFLSGTGEACKQQGYSQGHRSSG